MLASGAIAMTLADGKRWYFAADMLIQRIRRNLTTIPAHIYLQPRCQTSSIILAVCEPNIFCLGFISGVRRSIRVQIGRLRWPIPPLSA